ncbi:Cna B-type domain-containing protein [Companilactobacillus nantensis]|uniref:Collagen adhesin n=2 Tax=Companilactobacillus nantensis TaxID=305793 RepID=A0A0R1WA22_9LACO|nr:Cna B-type domain-containing protein [Companilactobacillus nantensis]KRM14737.1 Collagen adhesin [Companilactobacillus nantensis DSM 16982]
MTSSSNIVKADTSSTPEATAVTNSDQTAAKDWGNQLITKVQLQNSEGKTQDSFDPYDTIRAYWEFATPKGGVNENDTITVKVPDQLVITGDVTAPQPVTEIPGGKQIGTATLNKTARTVTVTFNSYAANKSKTGPVTGSFYVSTSWNLNLVQEHQKVPIDWNVNGAATSNTESTGSASVGQAAVTDPNEILYKYGSYVENGDIIQWTVRVNYKGETIHDAVYNDTLGKNQTLLNDTDHPITVNSATADHATGNITNDVDNKFADIKATPTKEGFTVNFGNDDLTKTAIITYYTKIVNLDDKSSSYSNTGDLLSNKDELQNITINQPNTTLGSDAHDGDQVTSIMGHKIWNVPAGTKIPDSVTINLIQNGNSVTPLASKTVTADTNWSYVFNNLPKYDSAGNLYNYTVQETPVAGFTSIPDLTSHDITNVLSKLKVTKVWNDGNDKYSQRPKSVIVAAYGPGIPATNYVSLSEKNNWTYTWGNLPSNGNWSVSEIGYNKTGYDSNDDGTVWWSGPENYIASQPINNSNDLDKTITNTLTTTFKVTKKWEDTNHESSRPTEVKVELYANGKDTGKSATLNSDNYWSYTFGSKNDLPKFDADKNEITYTAEETTDLGDYTVTPGKPNADDTEQTIINTYNKSTRNFTVNKVWNDNGNTKRPDNISVQLIKDEDTPVGDPVTITPDANDKWTYTWNDLDKNDESGNPIHYSVAEVKVPGYDSQPVVSDDDTNATITNTLKTTDNTHLQVSKTWSDDNNKDNIRPDYVTVNLLKDGTKVDSVKLNDSNSWKHDFIGLDKDAKYTISEDPVDSYTTTIDDSVPTDVKIINTHTPTTTTTPTENTTNLNVTKVWSDDNNKDNLRPNKVTVHLFKNGTEVDKADLSESNNWAHEFTGLDKSAKYSVTEDKVADYTTNIDSTDASNVQIINTHTPKTTTTPDDKTNLNVTKRWSDNNNQDKLRPDHVTVHLLKNGTEVDSATLNAANNWNHNFTGLDKTATYTITEDKVDSYTTNIDSTSSTNVQITNTHTPTTTTTTDDKTNLTVKKSWNDQNNQDKLRPSQVTIHLLKNGTIIGQPITLSSLNAWSYTWNDLDKNGKYTVQENTVPDYSSSQNVVDGVITITNTHNVTKTPGNPGTPTIPGGNTDTPGGSLTGNNGGNGDQTNTGNGGGSDTTTDYTPANPMVPSPIYQNNDSKNSLLPQTGSKDANIIYSILGFLILGFIAIFTIKRKQA